MAMVKRLPLILSLFGALFAIPAPALASDGTITFTGGGWGHSVGMSQYGAEGMARQGVGYVDILKNYYSGVNVGPVGGIADLKVGIAQNAPTGVVSAVDGSVQVRYTNGNPVATALAGDYITVSPKTSDTCQLKITGQTPIDLLSCDLDVFLLDPTSKVTAGSITVNHGFVFIRRVSTGFHVGAQMELEDYLKGIAEIPDGWNSETQKAQAVAARSYAIATTSERRASSAYWKEKCWCDLRPGPVDQNWAGYASESVRPRFVQGVNDTNGQAIVLPSDPNKALKAYYSSSTFGKTEPNEIGFGGPAEDYLRSADDSWAVNGSVSNSLATWTRTFDLAVVAARLGFDTISAATPVDTSPTGAVTQIQFTGTLGGKPKTQSFYTRDLRLSSKLGSTTLGCAGNVVNASCFPSLQVTGVSIQFIGEQAVIQDPTTGKWYLRHDNGAITEFYYGNPGDTPFMGDWDCDGVKTPGLYRRSDGYVYLRNSNTQGVADVKYFFGNPSDVPLAGDFDGDGCDTVSLYRPSEARFYIINRLGSGDQGLGAADYSFLYGVPGDVPIVGDWNGDGVDTPGLRRASNGFVYLRDTNTQGVADISYFYGISGDLVFSGDWDDDGVDTVGLYRPSNATVYLRNSHSTGVADDSYVIGNSKMQPAGAWAG